MQIVYAPYLTQRDDSWRASRLARVILGRCNEAPDALSSQKVYASVSKHVTVRVGYPGSPTIATAVPAPGSSFPSTWECWVDASFRRVVPKRALSLPLHHGPDVTRSKAT